MAAKTSVSRNHPFDPNTQRSRLRARALAAIHDAAASSAQACNLRQFFRELTEGTWHAVDAFMEDSRQVTLWRRTSSIRVAKRRPSAREVLVAREVLQGEPNKIIASHLGVSETTVSTHLHTLLDKLGLRNRSALVASVPADAFDAAIDHDAVASGFDDARARETQNVRLAGLQLDGQTFAALSLDHHGATASVGLTASELQVANLLAAGLSYKAIARARRASPNTIKNQSSTIYRKLGVHSRFELTARWCKPRRHGSSTSSSHKPPALANSGRMA